MSKQSAPSGPREKVGPNGEPDFRALFEGVMEHIPEGVTIAEAPDARIVAVSRFGQRLLGRAGESLIGRAAEAHPAQWQIYRPDGVTLADAEELPLTRATRRGEVVIDEPWILRRQDGSALHLLCNAGPIRDSQGLIRWGVVTWRDVTASRAAEAALRASEARLRRAHDIGGIGDWEWELATDAATWSPSLYRLLRLDPDSCSPSGTSFFELVHPEDRPRVEQAVRSLLDEGGPLELECRVVLAGGEVRWLASRGLLERDPEGRPLRIVGVNFDVTELKAAEAALAEERARLLAHKDSLLQEANHRIKNNLTLAASMLRLQARVSEGAQARTEFEESADRLAALGRLYDHLAEPGSPEVEAASYLRNLAASLEASLRRPGQRVAIRVETDACRLPAETATGLGLIVNELVTNACKHGRRPDGSCDVEVRFREGEGEARLSVEDRGPGLPAGFDPDEQTGLGVRLAATLARNLGGRLCGENLQQGARFTLCFPLASGDARADRRPSP